MIQRAFDDITKADIDALIASGVTETKTLEYKRELPGTSPDAKKEFLADVSSFANASGGDIIYGISEAVDADGKKTGTPGSVRPIIGTTADGAKLRLENMTRDGIRPPPRVQIKEVAGWGEDARGFVMLLRIPQSYASPHMVTFSHASRFFSRNSGGKYQLDVDEIRSAFALSEALPERIKRFREDRLGKIVADEAPVQLEPGPRIVLHLMPVAAFSYSYQVDLTVIDALRRRPGPLYGTVGRSRFNVDGFIAWSWKRPPKCCDYWQVFRNGIIEFVDASSLEEWNADKVIPSRELEDYVLLAVERYVALLHTLEVRLPIVVTLALFGVAGYDFAVQPPYRNYDPTPIDRDLLRLPDVLVHDYENGVAKAIRPIFDALWNAGGYAQCMNYDENDDRKPRQ